MDAINTLLLLVIAINIFFGVFVLNRDRSSRSAVSFFFLSVTTALWGSAMFLLRNTDDLLAATMYGRLLYSSASLIPIVSIWFAYVYPKRQLHMPLEGVLTILASLPFVLWLIWQPDMLIHEVLTAEMSGTREPHLAFNTIPHLLYTVYIATNFSVAIALLYRTYTSVVRSTKQQLLYILIGSTVTVIISGATNILLPFLGNFSYNWVGPSATTVLFMSIAYSVYRHKAFNLEVQFSEVLALLLVSMGLADLLISANTYSISLLLWKLIAAVVTVLVAKAFLDALFATQESERELQKLNKRLKELDQKKNEFLHMASHQLRSPITSINGYASLIAEGQFGKVSKDMEEPLRKILSAGSIMNETIVDYLDIARIEDKSIELKPERFVLSELVAARVEELRVNAEKKGLTIVVKKMQHEDCEVVADKRNITQVVNALIENAIKYTKSGGITVQGERDEVLGVARVRVSDTGIGVPKDALPHLFEKFSRASNAKEADVFGTGMGLYIAKSLMELNKGSITVESDGEGAGTTSTIELPLAEGH